MRISNDIKAVLDKTNGEGYKLSCTKSDVRLEKQEYILHYLKDKSGSLIDLGGGGHKINIDNEMKKGTWLHKKLDEVTTENWCIDINKETCDYLKEKWNRKDVICADVLTDGDYIKSEIGGKKDWILLADVIEHTVDPIGFLKAIKENKLAKKIIITVPNAFHFVNMFIAYKKNAEVINSDHKFWFTPYTLLKCCNEAGINVEEIDFCGFNVKGHKLPRLICKDIMASTIFVVGSL